MGYKWICMEWNQYGNSARAPAMRTASINHEMPFTIWFTRSGQPGNDMDFTPAEALKACVESQCDGFLGEGEIPAEIGPGVPNPQEQNWPALIEVLKDVPIPKGTVTNFAPFVHNDGLPYPEKAKPLIDAGWHCLTECYDMGGDPSTWIERRNFYATQNLGWPRTQPVLGIYGGRTFADFPTRDQYANWSVWDAGTALAVP